MKKLFLLMGMLFAFVLVQAMGVNKPPGMNYEKTVVCTVNHINADALADVNIMINTADILYGYLQRAVAIENAELGSAISVPDNFIETNINISDRGDIVSRNGVIKNNYLFQSIEPESILKFKANARTWVNLTTVNFHYLCLKNFQLTNFDGKAERFY